MCVHNPTKTSRYKGKNPMYTVHIYVFTVCICIPWPLPLNQLYLGAIRFCIYVCASKNLYRNGKIMYRMWDVAESRLIHCQLCNVQFANIILEGKATCDRHRIASKTGSGESLTNGQAQESDLCHLTWGLLLHLMWRLWRRHVGCLSKMVSIVFS